MDTRMSDLSILITMIKNLHLLKMRFLKTWKSTKRPKCLHQTVLLLCSISLEQMTEIRMRWDKLDQPHITLNSPRDSLCIPTISISIKVLDIWLIEEALLLVMVLPTTDLTTIKVLNSLPFPNIHLNFQKACLFLT